LATQHELLDTAIQKVGNRYLATMLIAKRIRQLYHGAPAQVQRQEGESNFSVAVREIAEGLVILGASFDTSVSRNNGATNEASSTSDETT
jgi:DNA-directed RNA polymerase omega subunit